MRLLLVLLVNAISTGNSVGLPSIPANEASGLIQAEEPGQWWAQVGDHVVHTPHADSGLSPHISDYYYAYAGSHKSIPAELYQKRVGGAGRVHIFHLPGGPESLQSSLPHKAGRRAAVSTLMQMQHKVILSNGKIFPPYKPDANYRSPLNEAGQQVEIQVVQALTTPAIMGQLKSLTQVGDNGVPTRSWTDKTATQASVSFIQGQFESMGYETCLQNVTKNWNQLTNVVAYLPGADKATGTVTLGAHYDSRPFEGPAPGAVDNGSGAAAVLSIARAFKMAQVKPQKNVFFVAFAAEEPGLWGSDAFASRMVGLAHASSLAETGGSSSHQLFSAVCGVQMPGVVSLAENSAKKSMKNWRADATNQALVMDEVAWKSPNVGGKSIVNLESYDWSGTVLENLAQSSMKHNGDALVLTHSSSPFGSDHMSFLSKGMQSVLSIHGDDDGYPHYHQSTDTIEHVNADLYGMITRMNAGALVRLAGI